MARDGKKMPPLKDEQEEMTVVILKFSGSGETLRKGFDTVSQALRQIAPTAHRHVMKALARPATETDPTQIEEDVIDVEPVEETLDSTNGDSPDVTQRTPRTRKPPKMPKMLNDLDVKSGDMPLEKYCQQKAPDSVFEKFAVIGAWFKHHRNVEEITVDHIFTCFPLVSWPRPDDIPQTFRNLKAQKQWFDKGSKPKSWRLTITGLNYVDNKLPKSGTKIA